MDIVYTPTGLPVDSAEDLESARNRAESMCNAFGDLYRAEPDLVLRTYAKHGQKMHDYIARYMQLLVEYEQIGKVAIRERDPEDYIEKDQADAGGSTNTYYKDNNPPEARWGYGKDTNRRIRIQDNSGKWVTVCKSTRVSRRGAKFDGGIRVSGPRLREQLKREHHRAKSKLPFKVWMRLRNVSKAQEV